MHCQKSICKFSIHSPDVYIKSLTQWSKKMTFSSVVVNNLCPGVSWVPQHLQHRLYAGSLLGLSCDKLSFNDFCPQWPVFLMAHLVHFYCSCLSLINFSFLCTMYWFEDCCQPLELHGLSFAIHSMLFFILQAFICSMDM